MSFEFSWVRFALQLGFAIVLSLLVYRIGFIDGRIHEQKIIHNWVKEQIRELGGQVEKKKRGRPKKQS